MSSQSGCSREKVAQRELTSDIISFPKTRTSIASLWLSTLRACMEMIHKNDWTSSARSASPG